MNRDDKPDRLDYMSDLILELERMAREEGLPKLATLLREAHEEAVIAASARQARRTPMAG